MTKLRSHLTWFLKSDLIIPLVVLLSYFTLFIFVRGKLPTGEELYQIFYMFYREFGYQIILLSAFLESLLFINFFVPGSIGMALGAVFARTGDLFLPWVILFAWIGAVVGYHIDYFLGRAGFHKILNQFGAKDILKETKDVLNSRGLILTYLNPTIASVVSFTAGSVKVPFVRFSLIATLSTLLWFTLWGLLFYMIGEAVVQILTRYLTLVVLVVICAGFLYRYSKDKKKS